MDGLACIETWISFHLHCTRSKRDFSNPKRKIVHSHLTFLWYIRTLWKQTKNVTLSRRLPFSAHTLYIIHFKFVYNSTKHLKWLFLILRTTRVHLDFWSLITKRLLQLKVTQIYKYGHTTSRNYYWNEKTSAHRKCKENV